MSGSSPSPRRRWRRLAIGFAIGFVLLAALAPPYGLRRDRDTYQCHTCLSKRHEFQWKVGEWSSPSLPLSPKHTVIEESKTYRRFTPQPHVHEWQYYQGSPYYWFGTTWGGCALGTRRHLNSLASSLEKSFGEIDDFLDSKLAAGQLTTNQLYAALVSPVVWPGATNTLSASQELAERLDKEFFDQLAAPRATAKPPSPTEY